MILRYSLDESYKSKHITLDLSTLCPNIEGGGAKFLSKLLHTYRVVGLNTDIHHHNRLLVTIATFKIRQQHHKRRKKFNFVNTKPGWSIFTAWVLALPIIRIQGAYDKTWMGLHKSTGVLYKCMFANDITVKYMNLMAYKCMRYRFTLQYYFVIQISNLRICDLSYLSETGIAIFSSILQIFYSILYFLFCILLYLVNCQR